MIQAQTWPDIWERWFAEIGAAYTRRDDELTFQNTGLTLQAAIGALGVAMAHGPLVDGDIAAGHVVAPFQHAIQLEEGYYFVCRQNEKDDPRIVEFKRWIFQEMRVPVRE